MPAQMYGAAYVAAYLGASNGSLHNWCKNPPIAPIQNPDGTFSEMPFPGPDVEITGLDEGGSLKVTARGWHADSLPDLRTWYVNWMRATNRRWRRMQDEAVAEHWRQVDENLRTGRTKSRETSQVEGQGFLFAVALADLAHPVAA